MNSSNKTKGQLIRELEKLRLRIANLLRIKVEHRQVKEHLKLELIEHKMAETALQESEEKYRNLVERANDGIVIIQDGIMKYANPRLAEMGGYTFEELVGKPFTDYASPAELPTLVDRYVRRMSGEDVEPIYETVLRRKDGSDINVEINASTISYQGRTADLVLVRDITERKQAEKELKASREQLRKLSTHLQSVREEERTRLARDIHDELGQALTALKIDLSWLTKRFSTDQELLLEKTGSMSELVDMTIQKVKRISTELRPGLLDDFGLVAAIEWQAGEFQKLTGIRIEISPKPRDIALSGDRSTALFRVFQELLTNVARHANATKVRVSLIEQVDKIVLKVGDNGRGITKKQLSDPRAFGLLGIRERVHFWQGEFKISGTPGKGTAAVVSIPLANRGKG